MSNDSFVFYRSFYDAMQELNQKDKQNVLNAVLDYAFLDREPEHLKGNIKSIFILIKPQIDANRRKRESGAKGGKQKGENAKKAIQTLPEKNSTLNSTLNSRENTNVNVNVNDNVNKNVNVNVNNEMTIDDDLTFFQEKRLTNKSVEEIKDFIAKGMSKELIRYAKDRAEKYGAKGWGYVRQMLREYQGKGVHTVEAAKASQQRKEKIPEKKMIHSDIYVPKDVLDELKRKEEENEENTP